MSKILYLSCHSILEYDEVRMLHELGHEVFSPGAYVEPRNPGDTSLRPGIPGLVYDPDMVEMWNKHEALHPAVNGKSYLHLSPHIIDKFDIVLVMHYPEFILNNWEAMKHKRVIWRTIGQSVASTEASLAKKRYEGLEIVRYSPNECYIPGFIGQDALIRFYKDPAEFCGWTGEKKRVITFAQSMQDRDAACNFRFFEETTRGYDRGLYGPGNEKSGPWATGKVPFEQLHEEMRTNRVYFYTGTHPASYTLNFMEARMTGIPIVAIGPLHGNAEHWRNHNLYEVSDLITHGVNGFVSDDSTELRQWIDLLLNDDDFARVISVQGRTEAIRHFGKEMISGAWEAYLNG